MKLTPKENELLRESLPGIGETNSWWLWTLFFGCFCCLKLLGSLRSALGSLGSLFGAETWRLPSSSPVFPWWTATRSHCQASARREALHLSTIVCYSSVWLTLMNCFCPSSITSINHFQPSWTATNQYQASTPNQVSLAWHHCIMFRLSEVPPGWQSPQPMPERQRDWWWWLQLPKLRSSDRLWISIWFG